MKRASVLIEMLARYENVGSRFKLIGLGYLSPVLGNMHVIGILLGIGEYGFAACIGEIYGKMRTVCNLRLEGDNGRGRYIKHLA